MGKSVAERAGMLLGAMTLDEKLSLLAGDDGLGVLTGNPATGTSDGVPRLGIPTMYHSDGPLGPREGQVTSMPSPLALAAAFDPKLADRVGATIADEVKHKGNDLVHAPTVDVMRTPLAGRTFEGYGEDPFLSSRTAVGWIEGAQREGIIANVKHFAPNSQEGQQPGVPPLAALVGFRGLVDARVDERTLREIYLPPFEAAVKEAKVGSVMCAYNRLNGQPACESRHLLSEILRGDWGFDGFVVSDYLFAMKSTPAPVRNGMEIEMPVPVFLTPALVQTALLTGQVSQADVDARVTNILRGMLRFGMFDRDAYVADDARIDKAAHAAVARENQEQGTVLLRNDGILPLDASRLKTIAVIGTEAGGFVNGGGSSATKPFAFSPPGGAIQQRAGAGVSVNFDPGTDPEAAAAAAAGKDVAIVFGSDGASEGVDKTCLALSCPGPNGPEDAVINAVAAANPNTVVVLVTAGPVLTPWRDRVRALVESWFPGQQAGEALARVLFGDADPGGRLPVTFPRSTADAPAAGADFEAYPGLLEARYKEGVNVGYRHYDARNLEPAYPFGHGLSYASFDFRDLRIQPAADGSTGATVSAEIVNTSSRRGTAVPQLYLGLPDPSDRVRQPPRQLKGFTKVTLDPGARRRVSFKLDERALSYWNTGANDWRIVPGCYAVMLGRSSRDTVLRGRIAVAGASCPGAIAKVPGTPRRCTSRRSVTITLFGIPRSQVRSVGIRINGRRIRTLRGPRQRVNVSLAGRPPGTYRVRLVVTTTRRKTLVDRSYRTCVRRRTS